MTPSFAKSIFKRGIFRSWVTPLLLASVLLTRCSCDFFGTTGALLISENDEMKLGADFDTHLRTNDSAKLEYPLFVPKSKADTAFRDYVVNLAQKILNDVPKEERPGYAFTYTIIDKDVVNAFAVPGGYVYIYTGIIKKMRNESELACVLGHETAHVTQHHYRDAMAKDEGLSLILQALLGNDSGKLAQLIAGSFFQLAQLKVSRGNESEADHFGTIYAGNAGEDPMGIATFFQRMPSTGFDWISTHPDPGNRVETVTAQVNDDPGLKALAADSAVTNFKDRYLGVTCAAGISSTVKPEACP